MNEDQTPFQQAVEQVQAELACRGEMTWVNQVRLVEGVARGLNIPFTEAKNNGNDFGVDQRILEIMAAAKK